MPCALNRLLPPQKIDKLKGQLSQLANLLQADPSDDGTGSDDLDEQELETLREAGIVPPAGASKRARRKSHSTKRPKHIIFANDPDEGTHPARVRLPFLQALTLILPPVVLFRSSASARCVRSRCAQSTR